MKNILIPLVLLFISPTLVSAADYYVSPNGTASWSECTNIATPCSLPTANENAIEGDTVYLREGIYTDGRISPYNSGNEIYKITFTSYNDESVIFDGLSSSISFGGDSYIKVHGIDVKNSEFMLQISDGSTHIEISHCSFYNTIPAPNGVPRKSRIWRDSKYNWIHNSAFHTAGYADEICDDRGGLLTVGTSGATDDKSSYNLIENNTFYQGGHHLVEIAAHHNVIRNNFMHNEGWMDCSHCSGKPALCGNRNIGGAGSQVYRNLYENNTLSHGGIPPDNEAGSGLEESESFSIIRKNKIYNNTGAGIMPYDKGYPVDYNHIYSNTVYYNAVPDLWHLRGGICFVRSYNNSVKNNILYANGEGAFCEYSYNKGHMEYQILENNWNDTHGDPEFVDPTIGDPFDQTKPDLRLKSNSLAIDAGVFLTKITSSTGLGTNFTVEDADYFMDGWGIVEGDVIQLQDSTKRVQITSIDYDTDEITVNEPISWTKGQGVSLAYEGSAPDIGAYEYVSEGLAPECLPADILCVDDTPGDYQEYSTIQAAANDAVAGDNVLIKGGVYYEFVNLRYTQSGNEAEGYINYEAFPGEKVVIDGTGVDVTNWHGLFSIHSKSYIKLRGIEIRESSDIGLLVYKSSNVIVEDVDVHDNGWERLRNGVAYDAVQNFSINNMLSYNNYYNGLRINGETGITRNGLVTNSQFFNNSGRIDDSDGVEITWGDVYSLTNITLINVTAFENAEDGIDVGHDAVDITIENCVTYGNGVDNLGGAGGGLKACCGAIVTFKNCISYDNRAGFVSYDGAERVSILNSDSIGNIYNGISSGSINNGLSVKNSIIGFNGYYESYLISPFTNYQVENNLYNNSDSRFILIDTAIYTNSEFESYRNDTGFDLNSILDNPLFIDFNNPLGPDGIPWTDDDGLRFQPSSPACGAGEGGSDIGAYECDQTYHRADNNPQDGCITMQELSSFIGLWYLGSATMPELMEGIALWKAGQGCS